MKEKIIRFIDCLLIGKKLMLTEMMHELVEMRHRKSENLIYLVGQKKYELIVEDDTYIRMKRNDETVCTFKEDYTELCVNNRDLFHLTWKELR